ncbi:dephospho-CoA kinase [bacterium]|nr:dephospho-CoA kinase [bacterium]
MIGLTGGIGCGKTEVAKIFQQLGAKIIDADEIGKTVVETQPEVLQEIAMAFGQQFVNSDGTLKRKELGAFVFADEEKKRQLNRIVHPHLFNRVRHEIEAAQSAGNEIIVVDAALIYETGIENIFDKVIVVNADLKNRIARIKQRDQLTDDEISHRIASQMPLDEKVRRANIVISNNGSVESLKEVAENIFRTFFD